MITASRMISHLCSAAALLGALAVMTPAEAQALVTIPNRTCDVTKFGAQGTKLWYDTKAFQDAIDSCAAAGGGTVLVPRGGYLIGPIFLKSNIRLLIAKYAEVLGGTDPALYGTISQPSNAEGKAAERALINAKDVSNIAISGEGLIDGQGAVWWENIRNYWRSTADFAKSGNARQSQHDNRPRLVLIRGSQNVLFEGVTFANSPSFNLVLSGCDGITIRKTKILAPAHAPNTDAIDPIDTRNVLIENNTISVGDDTVALKASKPRADGTPSVTNVIIRGNRVLQGRGISIGSGTSGGVSHVLAENNNFDGSMYGFRIKTRRHYGGPVFDIVFRNSKMRNVQVPFVFSSYYEYKPLDPVEAQRQVKDGGFILGNQIWPGADDPAQAFVANDTPDIHDITVANITATGADTVGIATGVPERAIAGLRLKNIRVSAKTGFVVRHAGVIAQNVHITVSQGQPVTLQSGGTFLAEKKH